MKFRSLNAHLLLVIVAVIALCWMGVLAIVLTQISLNRTSTWDEKLEAIATQLLVTIPADAEFDEDGLSPGLTLPLSRMPARQPLAFQIWVDRSRKLAGTPGAPVSALQPTFVDGAASTIVEGQRWRIHSATDSTGRVTVQVGNLQSVVDADMRDEAWHALTLATVLLLVAGVVMWFVVGRSLKHVRALGSALRQRRNFDLTLLPLDKLPHEIHLLVASFNHVLEQLNEAVEGERRFIGDAAHELRTPLSALQAQAEIALRATDSAEKDAALRKLLVVARRSTRLSEQLLDLASLHAGAKVRLFTDSDLSSLALHVAHEFEVHASQNRRALYLDLSPCAIRCNVDDIGILLRNLIDNAMRYTADGGKVLVRCGYVPATQPLEALRVYLEVSDDGPGVAESERSAIFVRFHRVAGTPMRGSGVGLSLVAGIAELHQARIETDIGMDGRGLTVRVVFPGVATTTLPSEYLQRLRA